MAATDPCRFKVAGRKIVQIGERFFNLRDLSAFTIDESICRSVERFGDFTPPDHHFRAEIKAQIIARALDVDVDALRDSFVFAEINFIFEAWSRLHEECSPDSSKLKREIMRGMAGASAVKAEAIRAKTAGSIESYYGLPVRELTDGQIAFFNVLCNCYDESQGENKVVSNKYLNGAI